MARWSASGCSFRPSLFARQFQTQKKPPRHESGFFCSWKLSEPDGPAVNQPLEPPAPVPLPRSQLKKLKRVCLFMTNPLVAHATHIALPGMLTITNMVSKRLTIQATRSPRSTFKRLRTLRKLVARPMMKPCARSHPITVSSSRVSRSSTPSATTIRPSECANAMVD